MEWILWALATPYNLLGYLLFGLLTVGQVINPIGARGARKLPGVKVPPGTIVCTWRAWFARIWKFNTTLGPVIVLHPRHLEDLDTPDARRILAHEAVHVRQYQDDAVSALFIALVVFFVVPAATGEWLWKLPAFVWGAGMILPYFGAMLGGALRYGFSFKGAYRQNERERSAYAQTDWIEASDVGSSWAHPHDKKYGG